MKRICLLLVLILVIIFSACGVSIDEPESDYAGSVSVRIHCETVLDKGVSEEDFPGIPVIFDGKASYFENATAYDVINKVLMDNKIHVEFENSSYGTYIKGLANIYAGDFGDMSGWLFKVNGEYAEVGCSAYKVNDGDEIELVYSCVMGDVD